MKKSILRQILNVEYAVSSLVALGLVYLMVLISGLLPEADETSFLNPIFDRIDFLNIDDVSLDAIFAMKDARFPDTRIVVINVGEVAPTPDGKIAAAVAAVNRYGARAIGIDVIFDGLHFERFGEDRAWEKQALLEAFKDVDNVVVVNGYKNETLAPAFKLDADVIGAVDHFGYASLEKDDDAVVRRFWPYRTIEGERWLAFPSEVLRVYDPALVEPLLALPEEPQIIYYSSTHNQFQGQTLPIDDVIEHPEALAPFYEKIFRDAIVLIGFVNEGGLWYPEDTHKTPMGRKITVDQRDGSARMGMEGPDMSGLLIHANVINMMLNKDFIQPVPEWVDWLLVFLLAYASIAVYRVLRTKPTRRIGVAILIASVLVIESLTVFFLPILAFFTIDTKISYDLMATLVFLYIPANALVNKLRTSFRSAKLTRAARRAPYPPDVVLAGVYKDDESFPIFVRIVHAALFHIHFVAMFEAARSVEQSGTGLRMPLHPSLADWSAHIPAVDSILRSPKPRDQAHAHFYRYLEGMKDLHLRDSYMKDYFFRTEFPQFNPHHYFEQWETIFPHVRRMFRQDLAAYKSWRAVYVSATGAAEDFGYPSGTSGRVSAIQPTTAISEGIYLYDERNPAVWLAASPFLMLAECKLHRCKELFVFAAAVPKQFLREELPMYYGDTVSCEAVIPEALLLQLNSYFAPRIEQPVEEEI